MEFRIPLVAKNPWPGFCTLSNKLLILWHTTWNRTYFCETYVMAATIEVSALHAQNNVVMHKPISCVAEQRKPISMCIIIEVGPKSLIRRLLFPRRTLIQVLQCWAGDLGGSWVLHRASWQYNRGSLLWNVELSIRWLQNINWVFGFEWQMWARVFLRPPRILSDSQTTKLQMTESSTSD